MIEIINVDVTEQSIIFTETNEEQQVLTVSDLVVISIEGDRGVAGATTRFSSNEILSGTINGVNAVFTTAQTPLSLSVYFNGLKQSPNGDYQLSGNQITFVTIPIAGDILEATYTY